jgi:hypothetical protein
VVTSLALLRARVNKAMGLRHHRDNEGHPDLVQP